MASTRDSSPVYEAGSSSTPQLSPNSKIRAMLAALDDSEESEQESVSGSARARLVKSLNKPGTINLDGKKEPSKDAEEEIGTAGEEEEEEEELSRPRGRIAAAMRAQAHPTNFERETTCPREGLDKVHPTQSNSPEPASGNEAASEESDVPVISRKRKIRMSRRSTPEPSLTGEPPSPGLFVSPNAAKSYPATTLNSDELPEALGSRFRVHALVEKRRQELLAKEKEADDLKAKKASERRRHNELLDEDELEGSDDEGGRRLTQQMKPTRKASKRALEEMHRETQRLSRNQQLAHYATTKKKFSKEDFLKRFNRPAEKTPELPTQQIDHPSSSSPAIRSDVDMKDTPPTSPLSRASYDRQKSLSPLALRVASEDDEDHGPPTIEELISRVPSSPPTKLEKGKGKIVKELDPKPKIVRGPGIKQRSIRVRVAKIEDRKVSYLDDSDSDLEIISLKAAKSKKSLDEVFDRIPGKKSSENQSLYALRMLAHLTSPGKQNFGKNKKPSMTTSEMQISLQQQARQQATREREERLQAARDRGVIIQTAEERHQEMADLEDLLSKARREGEEITKRERAIAKKLREESGEVDPLGDSSDDEDWEDHKKNAPNELNASDSEEGEDASDSDANASGEEDEEEMDLGDNVGQYTANPLFDNEASETEEDGEEEAEAEDGFFVDEKTTENGDIDEDDEDQPILQQTHRSRRAHVISDDEDESHDEQQSPFKLATVSPTQFNSDSPKAPTSVLRSATKTFIPGLTVTGPVGLGLTQIFAGTMDDSQIIPSPTNTKSQQMVTGKDSLAFLRRIPAPELPPFLPTLEEETQAFPESQSQVSHIPESQSIVEDDTQGLELSFTQSQIHGFDSLIDESQMTPFPESTQDVGFAHMTPIRGRFVDSPAPAVPTAMDAAFQEFTEETPIVKKKGRLQRRAPVVFSDDEDALEPAHLEENLEVNKSVFDVMRKASKSKKVVVDEFDKKKSKAKDMVNEQAEESEDEYAGLGGASDDESGSEADEYLKAMIDDAGGENVDKNKIAAFFADRERANDEKQVEKLYRDITSGMMRRKRGADYDLSDSDDGGEARRRMKRREFAKMRKALLADERIGKIAENPKRQAFLRAIEDRGSDDETNFLDEKEDEDFQSESQSQSDAQSHHIVPNSQPGDMGPPKRKRSDDLQETEERLPPNLRRTKPVKKPSNLSEIRESLSSLIDEPNSLVVPEESGSESESELEIEGEDDLASRKEKDKENRDPFALRRTKPAIIDRISLKRESSSTISNTTRLAFAVSTSASGFKVPPLLRRATTNSSLTSVNSSVSSGGMSTTERMAGGSGENIKRGGGKNSGVHYFARESERREKIKKTEDRREKKRFKGAEVRRKVVGGLLGKGKFE